MAGHPHPGRDRGPRRSTLARQDPDGQWAGGAYFPAEPEPEGPGQPYTATTWSLNALREWGVDAAVLGDTAARLDANSRWEYDDLPYWGGEVDCCINAFTLANGAWLGADVDGIAQWLLEHQLRDGGWNCDWVEGSTVSSFHSTLNVLDGLLQHEVLTDGRHPLADELREARHRVPTTCSTGDSSTGSPTASSSAPGPRSSRTRSAGSTPCSARPTTSGLRRSGTELRRTPAPPRRSRWSAPHGAPTDAGSRASVRPVGSGSRWTSRLASRPVGSRSSARVCCGGGRGVSTGVAQRPHGGP